MNPRIGGWSRELFTPMARIERKYRQLLVAHRRALTISHTPSPRLDPDSRVPSALVWVIRSVPLGPPVAVAAAAAARRCCSASAASAQPWQNAL